MSYQLNDEQVLTSLTGSSIRINKYSTPKQVRFHFILFILWKYIFVFFVFSLDCDSQLCSNKERR